MSSKTFVLQEYQGKASDFEAWEGPKDWKVVRKVTLQFMAQSGREAEQAERMENVTTLRAKSHYFPGAHARMRLVRLGRILNVVSVVNEKERNRFLLWQLAESS